MPSSLLRVFSTLGLAGVLRELTPRFGAARVEATLLPTTLLAGRIRAGEAADLAILVSSTIDELAREGLLKPGRTDLARSLVGIAVRAGAPRPDVSTVDAFTAAMLAARSLVVSRAGASGLAFAGILRRLGIADQVEAKAIVIPSGFTGELVARGEAEIAVQQVSELMVVPGLDIVGVLPREIECVSVFSAGVFVASPMEAEAQSLLALLASDAADAVYHANGLEPMGRPGLG